MVTFQELKDKIAVVEKEAEERGIPLKEICLTRDFHRDSISDIEIALTTGDEFGACLNIDIY